MSRQKLPERYAYKSDWVFDKEDGTHRVQIDINGKIETEHEDSDLSRLVDTGVALALIRNAGLDPLYEKLKDVLNAHLVKEFDRLKLLADLREFVASLEEI